MRKMILCILCALTTPMAMAGMSCSLDFDRNVIEIFVQDSLSKSSIKLINPKVEHYGCFKVKRDKSPLFDFVPDMSLTYRNAYPVKQNSGNQMTIDVIDEKDPTQTTHQITINMGFYAGVSINVPKNLDIGVSAHTYKRYPEYSKYGHTYIYFYKKSAAGGKFGPQN